MTRRRLHSTSLALGCLFGLLSCKPAADAPKETAAPSPKTVVFLSARSSLPFESGQRQFLMQLLANQTRAALQTKDAGGDKAAQAGQFAQAIAAKPFAIIIDPVDVATVSAPIQEAVAKGILVIGLGQAATAAPCTTVLYCDQAEMGRLAGKMAVRAVTVKAKEEGRAEVTGRVIEIRGDADSAISNKRHEGFMEALKDAPGVIVVHDASGGWTKAGGKERTLEGLRVQKTADIVYAHNDSMALGAAEAAGDQRESILIIGTDGFSAPEGGFTLVNNGDIDATVYQPLLVDFAWTIVRKKMDAPDFPLKPSYQLLPTSITPKDIESLRHSGLPPFPPL